MNLHGKIRPLKSYNLHRCDIALLCLYFCSFCSFGGSGDHILAIQNGLLRIKVKKIVKTGHMILCQITYFIPKCNKHKEPKDNCIPTCFCLYIQILFVVCHIRVWCFINSHDGVL